jgi:hypothetical protein
MFVVAILIAMFPRQLPFQTVMQMAATIVDMARGVTVQEPVDPKISNTGVLLRSCNVLAVHRCRFLRLLLCFILSTVHYFCSLFILSYMISLFVFFFLFVLFILILPYFPFVPAFSLPTL